VNTRTIASMLGAAALCWSSLGSAGADVPATLQAQLASKVASFDRNFSARAGGNAHILIVFKGGDGESQRMANVFAGSVRDMKEFGGAAKDVEIVAFSGAGAVAAACKSKHAAAVYLSSGLENDAAAVGSALAGADVLSIGASGAHADKGTVLGFDLEGGKPKLVINVARAKAQNVSLKAEVLKLARVVQ
jgi:hypothetical protein